MQSMEKKLLFIILINKARAVNYYSSELLLFSYDVLQHNTNGTEFLSIFLLTYIFNVFVLLFGGTTILDKITHSSRPF